MRFKFQRESGPRKASSGIPEAENLGQIPHHHWKWKVLPGEQVKVFSKMCLHQPGLFARTPFLVS